MDHQIAWRLGPDQASATNTGAFMARHGVGTLWELHERSVADPDWFWAAVVDFLGLPFDRPWRAVTDRSRGEPWTTWFPGSLFNLSRSCVDRWADIDPDRPALRSMSEAGDMCELSYGELRDRVARLAGGLTTLGVGRGDAVALFLPMTAEAVISLLGVARIGAIAVPIFSGFGAEAVAGRLLDPAPRVMVTARSFQRRGKDIDMVGTARRALELAAPDAALVVVGDATAPGESSWHVLLETAEHRAPVLTGPEDPALIAYTSGTTGRPKGAVHVHGGITVQVAAEGAFQFDVGREDVLMWATDMGWIMGPWVVLAGLANGATVATYDGAPDHPGPDRIWAVVAKLGVTVLGISPTLIRALRPHGAGEAAKHDLTRLRAFGSTGEPWNPDPWHWLFQEVGGGARPIINISGGTEIGACLLSVNMLQGVKPTSVGGPALGVDADVYDGDGRSLRGEVGELVVRGPWPGRTRGFWNDPERYLATYWQRFDDVWVHGDWASVDDDGFWYLHGRSDDTLNIAGKRIGPAEVESIAVAFPEVAMAAAVGLPDEVKGETIGLFLVPAPGVTVDEVLTARVEEAVTEAMGKSFRPAMVRWVGDLPRTRSAKIMRRVVRAVAVGDDPGDLSSLENPESLDELTGADR